MSEKRDMFEVRGKPGGRGRLNLDFLSNVFRCRAVPD